MYEGPSSEEGQVMIVQDAQQDVDDSERQCQDDVDTGESQDAEVDRARHRAVAL